MYCIQQDYLLSTNLKQNNKKVNNKTTKETYTYAAEGRNSQIKAKTGKR